MEEGDSSVMMTRFALIPILHVFGHIHVRNKRVETNIQARRKDYT